MAELSVFNVAQSLLQQLRSPAKDELLLWFDSNTELEKLENTVTTIKDVLHDAEQRQATDAAFQEWLLRLRDEMYKADDLFDSISTAALIKRVIPCNKRLEETSFFFSESNHFSFNVTTAHKVKEIREWLNTIEKDISQFGFLRRTVADERHVVRRKTHSHSYIGEGEVIGREEDREDIVRLLLKDAGDEPCVSVIAVVGIGGLGKTTLAQLVYNAKEVDEFFDLRLWACVNDFSDLKVALEEVMGMKAPSLSELQKMMKNMIIGKKFLLVLDDVWDDIREHWLGLKSLLDVGERGSKILITTRLTTVAQNLASVRPYYNLGELSDEHAWLLFKKIAFDSNQDEENEAKEAIGRQIVKKFPKVPLAIRTIGSFLYNKDKKQWASFVDNQGLFQTSAENQCLEDVGESYLLYLVQRGFFKDVEVNANGDIDGCRMHHLFHDLASQIGEKECLVMTEVPDDFVGKFPTHLLAGDIKDSLLQGRGIRSLVSLHVGIVERSLLDGVFLKLTSLRTLILRRLDVEEIPNSIGDLVHLRYLDLIASEKLKRLPDGLCKLHNLLILRLIGCSNLIKLPDDLQKLISLRHMQITGCMELSRIPSGLEEMTSLVMLDQLIVNKDHGGLRCLKHLNNLAGTLRIKLPRGDWRNCVAEAEESMLSCKTKLSKLVISFGNAIEGEVILEADAVLDRLQPPQNISNLCVQDFPGVKFPDWLSSLTNLVNLELNDCSNCVELPRLSPLNQLTELKLQSIPLMEYVVNDICDDSGSFFASLETLHLHNMPSFKGLWRPTGGEVCSANQLLCPVVPSLRDLAIFHCPNIKRQSLFHSLKYLPCLESLSFRGYPERELSDDENWEKEGSPWMSLTRLKKLLKTLCRRYNRINNTLEGGLNRVCLIFADVKALK